MTDIVVESYTNDYTIEVVDYSNTVDNIVGTTTVLEVPSSSVQDILNTVISATEVDVTPPSVIELETTDGTTIEVTTTTGPTGHAPVLYHGTAPPDPAVGVVGDLYLVDSGAGIGDLYQKDNTGWGTAKGNLRGGIASVNGISGTNIILGANNITTGVLPLAQIPTGTTSTTVALGNHLHTGVYEPVIASGLTTQYWRGDKTWAVIDKTSLGLGNVQNVDTTNADNITSGTLAFARHPTGTTGTTLAIGNHNHDASYVSLTAAQNVAGAKTFTSKITVDGNTQTPLDLKGGTADHVYVQMYGQAAAPSTRSAYYGFVGAGVTTFSIVNERTNGGITLQANGTGVITLTSARVDVGTALTTPALRVGTTATAGYVLTADASGNATWQQTANIITPGTTAQYYRGDLTWQTLDKTAVGLGNVVNAAQVDLTSNQTIAGTKTFSSEIVGPTTGNVLKVGTGGRLADVALADFVGILGQTTSTSGGVAFGGGSGFRISGTSLGAGTIVAAQGLTLTGSITVSGTITGNGSGLTALPGANITGTINIAQIPTGTTGTTVALGNHTHSGTTEPAITAGTTAQYWRGDKTWQTLNAAAVGLGNVSNVAQVDLTSGQTITGAKVMNNASNVFTGNGAALTALNATQLTSGTAPQARITPNTQRFIFTTGTEARPTGTTYVEWVGPVTPANATSDDTWTDTSVGVVEDPVISMPIGTIQMYAASTAPTNWLTCNGQAISRATYSALFTLIGTTYGAGDGTSTFNLPDLQGRVPTGYAPGNTKFDTMGETGGEETHVLTISEIPAHDHGGAGKYFNSGDINGTLGGSGYYSAGLTAVQSQGGGAAHNNLAPYITLTFIIKVL